ncbi:MAG: phosphatase PAP2 family protein [Pseudomonadota bacterium]
MKYLIPFLLAASALAIALLGLTDVDLRLAHRLFDPSGAFPLRHAWFTETFSHVYLKAMLTALAVAVVVAALYDLWRPRSSCVLRLQLRVVALSALLVPLVISLIKRVSYSHCPWSLTEFGGTETYVRLFEAALPGASAGHCMPAGHASSALWLISLTVFWLPHRPRTAAAVFCATLGFGLGVGWMQQLRGAHFLTHTLWSMWIACVLVSAIYWAVIRCGKLGKRESVLGVEPVAQVLERPL